MSGINPLVLQESASIQTPTSDGPVEYVTKAEFDEKFLAMQESIQSLTLTVAALSAKMDDVTLTVAALFEKLDFWGYCP